MPEIKCLKTFFIGLFLLTTGIAISLLVGINEPFSSSDLERKVLQKTLAWIVLILWIGAGFWTTIYGVVALCDE
jgi:Kef-type K+ transport system membrane component KefB